MEDSLRQNISDLMLDSHYNIFYCEELANKYRVIDRNIKLFISLSSSGALTSLIPNDGSFNYLSIFSGISTLLTAVSAFYLLHLDSSGQIYNISQVQRFWIKLKIKISQILIKYEDDKIIKEHYDSILETLENAELSRIELPLDKKLQEICYNKAKAKMDDKNSYD